MFNYEKNKVSFEFIIEKIITKYKESSYKDSIKILNNPFKSSLDDALSSRFSRSWDSSLGLQMQHFSALVAENQGFKILNDGDQNNDIRIKGFFSDETRKIISEFINEIEKSNNKEPFCKKAANEYMVKIKDSVLNTCGSEMEKNGDLIYIKDGVIYVIEEKAGGDLDKGKAKQQKEELLTLYALVISKFKKEILSGELDIKIKFATFYNKDNMDKGLSEWRQNSVKKNFMEDELLIGRDFWEFLCDDDKAYFKIMELLKTFNYELASCKNIFLIKSVENILENIDEIEDIEIKGNAFNMIKNEYLIDALHLNELIQSKLYDFIFVSKNEIILNAMDGNNKTLKFLSSINKEDILILLSKNKKTKEIKESCFIID